MSGRRHRDRPRGSPKTGFWQPDVRWPGLEATGHDGNQAVLGRTLEVGSTETHRTAQAL